ncbi:MAG: hypothetical protein JRH11_28070 [Deltaproteobacteria bacterium]|nr:hypothetical protein [Deltaproteobacteria bacterium]
MRRVSGDATCLRTSECAETETCTRLYRCASRCDTSSDCPAESFCGPDIADGRGCYPSVSCDLIGQNCPNGTACLPMENGATWCGSAGTAEVGELCDGSSPATLCGPGARCNASACEQICALSGGACPVGQSCVSLEADTGVAVGACR